MGLRFLTGERMLGGSCFYHRKLRNRYTISHQEGGVRVPKLVLNKGRTRVISKQGAAGRGSLDFERNES